MKLSRAVKKKILELGFDSLRDYCRNRKLDYLMTYGILRGTYTGEKGKKAKKIKQVLIKDFGREIFSNT